MFKLVDVCVGKMTLKEVERELIHYILKCPQRLIVDIKLVEDDTVLGKGYHTTIWIDKESFQKKC